MNASPKQRLWDGRTIDIFNLTAADVEIRTIAHALSLVNRFGGHTKRPYSVAQHSVYVALRVLELTKDINMCRRALLHDASEAFIGDIVRPLKHLAQFEFYRDLEHQIQRKVFESVGLWDGKDAIQHEVIRQVDNQMLALEMFQLFNPPCIPTGYGVPRVETFEWRRSIRAWKWSFARTAFLNCFDSPLDSEAYLKVSGEYSPNSEEIGR